MFLAVFSKCSPAMEDGKRYENMAWRIWGCQSRNSLFPPFERRMSNCLELPELSSSVGSESSNSESALATTTPSYNSRSNSSSSRPDLRRQDSASRRDKHITPIDLEKVMNSIQKKSIEPLSPLPPQLSHTLPVHLKKPAEDTTPRPSSPPPTARFVPESSTSTVATALTCDNISPPVGSDVSTSTDFSSHSVVHGFDPSRISTSIRSSTNLNPTPILKNTTFMRPEPTKAEPVKKNKAVFTLGGSSDEENVSSLDSHMHSNNRSSLSDNLRKPALMKKTASFNNTVTTRTIHDAISSEESEEVIESESEEDSDENAIEDDDYEDDDDDNWEDDDNSGPSSVNDKINFPRVDSRPNLTSHRSLLTSLMHEGDRAQALQNQASRSTPQIRRSRTSTPNGPSTGNSPQEDSPLMIQTRTRSKPIIMTTSNVHPPALSPRTTRRNMLQTELTQSLRQNLLWERQQKNSTTNAVNKRHQSAVSIPALALRRAMTTNDIKGLNAFPQQGTGKPSHFEDVTKNNNSYNDYFDQGLQEYHQKGW